MKKLFTFLLLAGTPFTGIIAQTGMGIGTNSPAEKLDVVGAIKIGTTTTTNAGTIRWNGSNFQGYNGSIWVNLDGGGADSDWTVSGNNQYSAVSGNVGIGTSAPGAKLEVAGQIKITGGTPGANKVLTSDAAGLATWETPSVTSTNTLDQAYDQGGLGSGRVIAATDGAVRINGDDGFLVTGTFNSGDAIEVSGSGTRMFFNPLKAAFRAGNVDGAEWNNGSIGDFSMAMGRSTTASGNNSTAIGRATTASGSTSTAMGSSTIASGDFSTAMGDNTTARSYVETTIGRYNTDYTPTSTTAWNTTDRLFVIGNGISTGANTSNALIIYKDGKMNINDAYDMPTTGGINGQVLTTNGSVASWVTPTVAGDPDQIVDADGNTKVQVEESANEDKIRFDTGGSERMIIDNAGNIGIGVTSPVKLLEVRGNDATLRLSKSGTTSAGNVIGALHFDSENGISTVDAAAQIEAIASVAHSGGAKGAHLTFSTKTDIANNDEASNEHMRITSAGNIGIGTSAPNKLLHVASAVGAQMLFTRADGNTNTDEMMGEILFDNNDNNPPDATTVDAPVVIRASASQDQGNSNKGGYLSILTKNNANQTANATERMRVEANGTVKVNSLAGTGTRMVVADASGDLSTQTITVVPTIVHASVVITLVPNAWNNITHNFNISNVNWHAFANNGDRGANVFNLSKETVWVNSNTCAVFVEGGSSGAARINVTAIKP